MENEYEVETVLKAKVFMRGKKMGWKFYIKWKGYEESDNTWEPFKSFEGSGEGIIERFWDCVDTKGRDVNSIEGWTNGEEVFPTGSPRRKGRPASRKDNLADARPSTDVHPSSKRTTNGKRAKRPLESPGPEVPSKRKRASSSRRKSGGQPTRRALRESSTPVPDSQSEGEMFIDPLPKMASDGKLVGVRPSELAEHGERRGRPSKSSRILDHVKAQPSTLAPVTDATTSSTPPGPRDEVDLPQEVAAPQTFGGKKSRGGLKGRNASLLTFSKKKGALQTIRRERAVKDDEALQDTDEVLELLESTSAPLDSVAFGSGSSSPKIPLQDKASMATTSEQRKLANNGEAEDRSLPDYEERNRPVSPPSPTLELPGKMPTSISFPEPTSGGSSPWERSTIFGPFNPHRVSSSSILSSFLLSLDNSTSIPVALKDVSSAQTLHDFHIDNIVSGTPGPPGNWSCARLVLDNTATAEQRIVFDAFCSKLEEGGLFVVMASSEVLACCSSTNRGYTKKLALATSLQGLSGTVVVSHVKVANFSAFADAAAQAENIRW
ncbi:hypothetical protein BJV78DRAFT_1166968 [Lactifluus subvellereus]|nr:hypothetical protein BJV78DRAFT_1166968 [Lactifluus subvellereus]